MAARSPLAALAASVVGPVKEGEPYLECVRLPFKNLSISRKAVIAMNNKAVEQHRAELTLPNSTHSITSNDLTTVQLQARTACKAEGVNASFDDKSGENTVFILDDNRRRIGQIVCYEVDPALSINQLIATRREAQKQQAA